jgi:hypothetical protein
MLQGMEIAVRQYQTKVERATRWIQQFGIQLGTLQELKDTPDPLENGSRKGVLIEVEEVPQLDELCAEHH